MIRPISSARSCASLGGILHDQMLVLDECISDLNLLVLRDRTRSVESGGVTRSTGEAESSAFAGGLTGACGMMIHLLIRCVMRVRPDEHTTFHLAMLSDRSSTHQALSSAASSNHIGSSPARKAC